MKLELKHLAPYLPYSLKVIMEGKKTNVAWMSTKNIAVIRPNGIGEIKKIKWEYAHLNAKPILRPLSDITRDEYWKLSKGDQKKDFGFWYGKDVNGEYLHFEGYTSRQIRRDRFKTLPYYAFEFLSQNHFDVFGLIEKGLAIDINTLNR